LIERKMEFAGKREGLYCGKEQETFREALTPTVKMGGQSKAVRELMGRGMNRGNEEEKGLVVGELGRRVVADQ
jgi:hypothetical protein